MGNPDRLRASSEDDDNSAPTAERVTLEEYTTSEAGYVIYCLHVATYAFAARYVTGKCVLDLGCGTGYGTRMLAETAESVIGVDVSAQAINRATATYSAKNLQFVRTGSVPDNALPFPDDTFDVVLSAQVIEHIEDAPGYLREVRRVLRPDGAFICVTPDRTLRLWPGQRPWNKFHVTEYRPEVLAELLQTTFSKVAIYGMTAPDRILVHELRRYGRARLRAYPFTFPGSPEWWRRTGFRVAELLGRRRHEPAAGPPRTFDFGPDDIVITRSTNRSVNIVAVATEQFEPVG